MNKLDKFLFKLDNKTRAVVKEAISLIQRGDISMLDIKKLKGTKERYRVRLGRIRVIFDKTKNGNQLQDISYRDDNTY